ncbi:hypothetical protein [Acinetobacter pollinis]|uniref:hypothetical protein n=1 Tax=Acinetobacter pollinis TaxID=2605270 RepID=UPI0018C231AB|nr:hypothetical protein [Acinetobacter pollinis]MBF7692804.1 hypothetical protein [Acinetobacter pollinis]
MKLSKKIIILLGLWLSVCIFKLDFSSAFKILALFLGVSYLCIMDKEIYPKLKIAFYISCLFCLVQFIFYWFNPAFSSSIAGSNLSTIIWGEKFATPGFVNQYEVLFLPRMGGLSREAGFFASLVIIMALIIYSREKTTLKEKILHSSAYIFSLSKVSFTNLLIIFLFPLRKVINKVPVAISIIALSLSFIFLSNYINMSDNHFALANESVAHRLSSSYLIPRMKELDFIFGCIDIENCEYIVNSNLISDLAINKLYALTGLNGIFVNFGLIGFILLVFSFWWLGLKSFDVVVLTLISATVGIYTIDNFVILTYYFLFTYKRYIGE